MVIGMVLLSVRDSELEVFDQNAAHPRFWSLPVHSPPLGAELMLACRARLPPRATCVIFINDIINIVTSNIKLFV